VVILGDHSEKELAAKVQGDNDKIHSLAGETNLTEAMALLKKCNLFMGSDSGLMHLAAALDTPTLTLWGPSDRSLYSWEQIDPSRHAVITAAPECGPCNSWLNPNTSRVSDPLQCPDYQCMKDITVDQAFEAFTRHWKQLQNQPI
jgi:ADP-heptose:LPS heptosyltransferase